MHKIRPWAWTACFVLVAIFSRNTVGLTADTGDTSTTPPPGNQIVLDYTSTGQHSVHIEFSYPTVNPDHYIITLRSGTSPVIGTRKVKILVVLESMVCDPNSANRTYLWVKDGSGNEKHLCEHRREEIEEKLIISDGFNEIKVGTSELWDTETIAGNNATIRATAYYDSDAYCRCLTSMSFCCESCGDSKVGYCINKDFRCRYKDYCPCKVADAPDPDNCAWFPEIPSLDDGVIHISMSLMVVYLVLAVCLAVAITYLIPRLCRDRWQKRRAAAPAASQPGAAGTSSDAAVAPHPDAECPPPSYESMTVEEFSLKHLQIPDEPPPPSYETIIEDVKL